jgi:hypothetical protein
VSPANDSLVNGKLLVCLGIGGELTSGEGSDIKIGAESSKQDVYKFGVGVAHLGASSGQG